MHVHLYTSHPRHVRHDRCVRAGVHEHTCGNIADLARATRSSRVDGQEACKPGERDIFPTCMAENANATGSSER